MEQISRTDRPKHNYLLDYFRGWAMMYVVFIHCIFWIGYFNDPYEYRLKTLFLIEMPLFFTVAGAANFLGRSDNLKRFWINRIQRILIPYWIYAAVCLAVMVIWCFQGWSSWNLNSIDVFMSWLVPLDFQYSNVGFLTRAIWFVPVYLMVIIFFPFLKRYYSRYSQSWSKLFPLFGLIILVLFVSLYHPVVFTPVYYLQSVIFYLFWVYLGILYVSEWQFVPFQKRLKPVLLLATNILMG